MKRSIYLLSVALLIVGALFTVFVGTRFIRSPVGIFQIASLLNTIMPMVLGGLLFIVLSARFVDAWKGRIAFDEVPSSGIASFSQKAGMALLVIFCVLLAITLVLYVAAAPLRGEIVFLVKPLFRTLPIGFVLFELGRTIDRDRKASVT